MVLLQNTCDEVFHSCVFSLIRIGSAERVDFPAGGHLFQDAKLQRPVVLQKKRIEDGN